MKAKVVNNLGPDWNSTSSRKFKPDLKMKAVEILAKLAFTSLEEPNLPMTTKVIKTGKVWTIAIDVVHEPITIKICGGYYSKGERLRRAEINRITEFLKQIAESETEDTTEGEKRVIQAAYEGLERIEKRMALLKKYGPKSEKVSRSIPKQKREKGKPRSMPFVDSDGKEITFTVPE